MNKPLSFSQAQNICSSYQFLLGASYDKNFTSTTPVLSVMIAPADEQAQQDFMDNYDKLGYTDLNPYPVEQGYEVIVVARYQPDEEICLWMDLRSFVKRNMKQVAGYHKVHLLSSDAGNGIFAS